MLARSDATMQYNKNIHSLAMRITAWLTKGKIMLEGLDQINWGLLKHAHGPATDVPDLLRALASDDKEVRDKATTHLFGNIWHQGTIFQATSYAVPFLLELLEQPVVEDKATILSLLQAIVTGASAHELSHPNFDIFRDQRNTPEFQALLRHEEEWLQAARKGVITGIPLYLQLLADFDPEVRSLATYVAVECRAHMSEVEQALRKQLATETHPTVRAVQLIGLAYLWWRNSNDAFEEHPLKFSQGGILTQAMRAPNEAPVVRLVAAWLLVKFFGCEFLPEALPVFRETVGLAKQHYVLLEWMKHNEFVASISLVLRPFPEARLQWLIDMLHHPNPDVRGSAVWESKDVCHERRSAPDVLIPHLVPLLYDADSAICRSVVSLLFDLSLAYPVLTELLENLRKHPSPAIREQAATEYKEQEKNRNVLIPPAWVEALLKPMRGKGLPELISILEEKLSSRFHTHSHECGSALACLIQMDTDVRPAVPVLYQALAHESTWVRVLAARALWKIERDAASIMPILLRALDEFADISFISECFADMGRHAQAALPILQYIVDAEERWAKFAPDPLVIRIDELHRSSARQAIERIQVDMAAASNLDRSSLL
ncbi:MAG: hypothetical protein U0350_19965 [Caldilineaceae bacterium]